jgi:hypothetical protein
MATTAPARVNAGTIDAPNGTITFTVAGATVTGYLEAQDVAFTVADVTQRDRAGDRRHPGDRLERIAAT